MDFNFKLERKSSIRKLGRSKSTLLASELIINPCGDHHNDYYERISQSMRHVEIIHDDDEVNPILRHKWKKKKKKENKAWVFLMRVFSFKKIMTTSDEKIKEESVGAGEKPMEVVDKMNKKKMQSSSWEITQKADEVEKKKIRQPTFLPDPYRRWPVQGWRY